MEYLGLLVMGILLSTLGIVNIMGNISTIHAVSYTHLTLPTNREV